MLRLTKTILSLCSLLALACAGEPTLSLVLVPSQEVIATQLDVASASTAGADGVSLQLQGDAVKRLEEITAAHLGEHISILVDGAVVSAPEIKSTITSGRLELPSTPETKALAARFEK